MSQQKPRPSTAAQRAKEALDKAAPAGKSPARKTLAFLLEGSHDAPTPEKPAATVEPAAATTVAAVTSQADTAAVDITLRQVGSGGVTPPDPTRPLSPERDFNKRANSLDRVVLPAGLFPGSSKKLYDALYIRTRGALKPGKTLRATKRELSDWSGIRNVKTIDAHLRYFGAIGLIISEWEPGQNEGALYEVLLPEETSGILVKKNRIDEMITPDQGSPHVTPPDVGSPQILGLPSPQNLGSPHPTYTPEESITYENSKTFIKTNTENDDDEAFAELAAVLKKAVREITGKGPSSTEKTRWAEVGEVLMTELRMAAGRTTVSNVPAFLAEHLRRRLWKKEKRQIEAEAAEQRNSSPQAAMIDAAKCPDCSGTGMYYPDGFEKGVARCPHAKLTAPSDPHLV